MKNIHALLLLLVATPVAAQAPAARPSDVDSIGSIIEAVYDVISGGAGEARDWDRFRSLFADDARLVPSGRNPTTGRTGFRTWSVDEYIERAGSSLEQSGFFEVETHRVVEEYGSLAHAFSTYESRRREDDPEPFVRGINSIQLLYDGERWWVMSIYWTDVNSSGAIPGRYLPGR